MGKFRITTTEREDDRASGAAPGDTSRSLGCAVGDPSRSLGCADSCTPIPIDTPGYGPHAKEISPLTDKGAQE